MKTFLTMTMLVIAMACSKGGSDSGSGNNNPPPPPPPVTQNNNTIILIKPNADGGIYTIDGNGGNAKLLKGTGASDSVAYANWPLGDVVYFCGRFGNDEHLQIYQIKSDGTGLAKVIDDPANEYTHLHVLNNKMVYQKKSSENGGVSIFKNVLDGSEENKIMDVGDFTVSSLSWVPMANKIIIVSDEPVTDGGPKVSNMYYVFGDGTGKTNLTGNTSPVVVYDKPHFCPDGSRVAFVKTNDSSAAGYGVYTADPNFGLISNIVRVTSKSATWSTGNWSTDLTWILITDIQHKLYRISFEGMTKSFLNSTNTYQPKYKN